ncbi:MAG: YdeI/OmpD-associated family protein, partial [Chitinophagaceae bacterium]|nr:YdeI/OmpD-associated family protein [Chitinophagaceae bacterium]
KRVLVQLKLKAGMQVSVDLKEDDTALQFDIPEEFSAVMETDPVAREVFDGLTDGRKRGLIQLVHMVKSPDKKIERALKIAEKIKYGITSPQQIMKS